MTIEFTPWPKIARLNRDIVITEKLDGTNAAIVIIPRLKKQLDLDLPENEGALWIADVDRALAEEPITAVLDDFVVLVQSRNRFITPGKSTDNYGFAGWVQRNAEALVATLGEGIHYGEWWGSGIQRGYDMPGGEKRFSLFNVGRWGKEVADRLALEEAVPGLDIVPVLYEGPFDTDATEGAIFALRAVGSLARQGFMRPEGIVVWHTAQRTSFKVTLEGDEAPKKTERRTLDLLPPAKWEVAA